MNSTLIHISETGLYDYHKDAYGVKGRHYKEYWTEVEVAEEFDRLEVVVLKNIVDRKSMEDISLKKFRKLIKETIAGGAGDCKNALRWLAQYDTDSEVDIESYHEMEHFLYTEYHLSFKDIKDILDKFYI